METAKNRLKDKKNDLDLKVYNEVHSRTYLTITSDCLQETWRKQTSGWMRLQLNGRLGTVPNRECCLCRAAVPLV